MRYKIRPEKDIVSITGHVDQRDLVTNEDIDQGGDQEDKAWSIAAYAWASEELEED